MTLFGIVWVFVITYCFLKKDIRYMAFVTLLFMCFQSVNVLYLKSSGVGPQILTSIVFIFRSFFCGNGVIRIFRNKKNRLLDIGLILLMVLVLYSSLRNGVLQERTLTVLQLFFYIGCFICMERVLRGLEEETVYRMLKNCIIIIAMIGIIQWLVSMEILHLRLFLKVFIYNEDGNAVGFNSLSRRVYSTFMEPSYFSGFVVGAFYYLLSISTKWKENVVLMGILFVELLLSRSSTGFGAFLIVGVVFIAVSHNINIQWKIVIIVGAIAGFLLLYFGFYDLLDSVIFSKTQTGSFRTRNAMNYRAMQAYKTAPWFGIGYKEVRGSSIISTLLGQLGVLGLTLYILINIKICLPVMQKKERTYCSILSDGARLGLLSAVVCQVIACPDVDLCTYWFWMYAVAVHLAVSEKYLTKRNSTVARRVEVMADDRWIYKAKDHY